jgi:hypothetical protein
MSRASYSLRPTIARALRPIWRGMLLALLAAMPGWVAAADDEGDIEIRTAGTRLEAGVWYVSANVDYRLSSEARDALTSGLTLTFLLDIELERTRRWLPDDGVASLLQSYQLSYQPLTQRYVVRNLNGGEQTSYVTLLAALTELGRLRDLPLIDAALLEPDATYEIALRAALDQQTLPGPLQALAFWESGLDMRSEWWRGRLGE